MTLEIGNINIALGVVHLQPLVGTRGEGWNDDIGGEDDVAPRRRETIIDARRDHRVGGCRRLEVQFAHVAMVVEDCSPTLSPDIHHRQLRVAVGESMTVHAPVLLEMPVGKGFDIEIRNVPLLNLEVIPHLVVGFDEPVGKYRVDGVGGNGPPEGFVGCPLTVILDEHLDHQVITCVLLHHLMPLTVVEDNLAAVGSYDRLAVDADADGLGIATEHEVERCDIPWYCHVGIVGIYRWQGILLYGVLDVWRAGRKEDKDGQGDDTFYII